MIHEVASAIERILPKRRPIGHHEAYIGEKERQATSVCMQDLTGDGCVKALEKNLAKYCGVENAVAVSSGTAALHLALLATGVKPGEEVLVPALTFVATANAVSHCGAIPNFIDGKVGINAYKLRRYLEKTTCPNPSRRGRLNCKTGRVISALIGVDLLGFPADWPKISEVADEFGLILIEDAAQALGSSLGNKKCGSFGRAAILSFNNNKIITGNGGGAVLTDDAWIAAKVWSLATTARLPHPWLIEHDQVAYNYRMGNINAAIAGAQLEQIENFLEAKFVLLLRYGEALEGYGIRVMAATEPHEGWANYWLTTVLTDKRNELLIELQKRGINARALFTLLPNLPMYADCPHDNLGSAENTQRMAVCLPSGIGLALGLFSSKDLAVAAYTQVAHKSWGVFAKGLA